MIYKFYVLFTVASILLSFPGLANALINHPLENSIPNHAVILQYHHVSDETPPSTSISVEQFAEHVKYLANNGYQVKSLAEVVSALRSKMPLPDKSVVITFDDAYQSIYTNAYPLLKERGWSFTVFVNSSKTYLNPKLYLSWEQLREMATGGAMIANHSLDHKHLLRRLDSESRADWLDRIEHQITGMQSEIVEQTGEDARYFAYPYGEANVEVRNRVEKLGFVGLGQHSGPIGEDSDFGFLPRFPMSGVYSELTSMQTKLLSLPFPVLEQQFHQPVVAYTIDRPELNIKMEKGNFRLGEIACYASENGRIPVVIHTRPKQEKVTDRAASTIHQTTITVRSDKPIIVGRSRYNCTAPHRKLKRYYWYSAFWYRLGEGDQWIEER